MATAPAGFLGLGFSKQLADYRSQQVLNRGQNTIASTGSTAEINAGVDTARALQVATNTAEHGQQQMLFNREAQQATSPDAYRAYMAKQACCFKGRMGAVQKYGLPYDGMYRLSDVIQSEA